MFFFEFQQLDNMKSTYLFFAILFCSLSFNCLAQDPVVIAEEGAHVEGAEHVIRIPIAPALFQPVLATVPLQVFAYEMAVVRGNDVDQPRNLAKSVTVE